MCVESLIEPGTRFLVQYKDELYEDTEGQYIAYYRV